MGWWLGHLRGTVRFGFWGAVRNRAHRRSRRFGWRLLRHAALYLAHLTCRGSRDVAVVPSFVLEISYFPIGRRLPGKKHGNGLGATRIASVVRMADVSVHRSQSALGAAPRRKARHKGMKVTVLVTARKLATLVYRLLRWEQDYVDIGEAAYETRYRDRTLSNLKKTAKSLGYDLVANTTTAPAPQRTLERLRHSLQRFSP